jgi:hypothetical protein
MPLRQQLLGRWPDAESERSSRARTRGGFVVGNGGIICTLLEKRRRLEKRGDL